MSLAPKNDRSHLRAAPAGRSRVRPPKTFAIDVTRALNKLAAGEAKFNSFALRTVPDRGVDEGYIVRFDMPAAAKVRLELDVYNGE